MNKILNKKCSGVLLPVSSLPGKYGIGQIGQSAYNFIDFLSNNNFKYWEILPLSPTNITNSPYQAISAIGLNTYLIDFDLLVEDGLLNSRDFQGIDFGKNPRRIEYKKVFNNSRTLLYKAYKRFNLKDEHFVKFCTNKIFHDYAIYMSLKELNDYHAWYDWRLEDRYFETEVEQELMKNHSDIFKYHLFTQYIFCLQWMKLKSYANSKGIFIIGQVSHFVGYDSDVVYLHPELFMLDKLGRMTLVAGFPPDDFSKDGQKWGEPLYDWTFMKTNRFKWWKTRFYESFYFYDAIMLNHFSGFCKAYGIPFRSKNGKSGQFFYTSGLEIFSEFKDAPIIASDLGNTDPYVTKFIEDTGFITLSTACLPLFSNRNDYSRFLPSNSNEKTLLYIGNHDNNTLRGRLEKMSDNDREFVNKQIISECNKLNVDTNYNFLSNREMFNKILEIVSASNARLVTFTMQDILYQGEESRMNYPGKHDDRLSWTYRFLASDITKVIEDKWKDLNKRYKRD